MLTTNRLSIVPLTIEQFDLLLKNKEHLEISLGLKPSGVPLDEHTHETMTGSFERGRVSHRIVCGCRRVSSAEPVLAGNGAVYS